MRIVDTCRVKPKLRPPQNWLISSFNSLNIYCLVCLLSRDWFKVVSLNVILRIRIKLKLQICTMLLVTSKYVYFRTPLYTLNTIIDAFVSKCHLKNRTKLDLQICTMLSYNVVSGSKKYDHITPVLKDLHWLPIRKRIEFKILLLTFKCMQGCAPLYLRKMLVKQANTRTLRSNTKNVLQIPLTNLKRFGDRAFCAYAPRLWNELPDYIKAADSVQNFKKQLKTLLFRKEFN